MVKLSTFGTESFELSFTTNPTSNSSRLDTLVFSCNLAGKQAVK